MKKMLSILICLLTFLLPVFPQSATEPPSLMIVPFDKEDGFDEDWGDRIETTFLESMVEFGWGTYAILERGTIAKRLADQGKRLETSYDETVGVVLGAAVGARKVVLGKIRYAADTRSATVSAILADVASGRIDSAALVDTVLYTSSMRYWVGILAQRLCGTRIAETPPSDTSEPVARFVITDLPIPAPETKIGMDAYLRFRRAISDSVAGNGFPAAIRNLDELDKKIKKDSSNPYFRGNLSDVGFLDKMVEWEKTTRATVAEARLAYDTTLALGIIKDVGKKYVDAMNKGSFPDSPVALAIRWAGAIDRISRFPDADSVFVDPSVEERYGEAFRLNLADDLRESRKGTLAVRFSKPRDKSGTTSVIVKNEGDGTSQSIVAKNDGSETALFFFGTTKTTVTCDGESIHVTVRPRSVFRISLPSVGKKISDDLKPVFSPNPK